MFGSNTVVMNLSSKAPPSLLLVWRSMLTSTSRAYSLHSFLLTISFVILLNGRGAWLQALAYAFLHSMSRTKSFCARHTLLVL